MVLYLIKDSIMKKFLYTLAALSILISSSQSFAYVYSFSNHTQYPIFVAIKLCCAFEKIITKLVKPNRMITFAHGEDFPNIKFGYCLQSIAYVKNPIEEDIVDPATAPWQEVNTTWIKSEAYENILEFAESVGETTEGTAKLITEAVLAAETGGASAGATAAATKAKDALKKMADSTKEEGKSSKSIFPSLGLGKFGKGLAKLVAITTCRDRHWDIREYENGIIRFESKIQQ
jgi:hypothetical protein